MPLPWSLYGGTHVWMGGEGCMASGAHGMHCLVELDQAYWALPGSSLFPRAEGQ